MTSLMLAITERKKAAIQSGHLQPLQFDMHHVPVNEFSYQVCLLPSFPAARKSSTYSANTVNPFLPPDPALTVGRLGDYHHLILNKYPVCETHLVLARVDFIDQRCAIQYEDFLAVALLLVECGGLGFFNGGPDAGASQAHFHLQWLPSVEGNPSIQPLTEELDRSLDHQLQRHELWDFEHAFIYLHPSENPHDYARELFVAYQAVCQQLQLIADEHGFMPAMNVLVQDGWLLIIPRRHDELEHISLNALSFAGVIYVRRLEYVQHIKNQGVLRLFAEVTHN